MSAMLTSMRRLVTRRSWLERNGLLLVFWLICAALSAVALLILVTLLTDLLVSQGGIETAKVASTGEAIVVPHVATSADIGLQDQAQRFGNRLSWRWLAPVVESLPILKTTRGALVVLIVLTLFAFVAFSLTRIQARVASAGLARDLATWLRSLIHRQTLRLGPSDLTGHRYQTALSHFIDDSEAIRATAAEWRWRFVRSIILLPTFILCVLAIDLKLGVECLIPTIACWFVYRYERQQGATKRQISEAHADSEVRFLSESLKQTRLVRGYNMEEFEQSLFSRHLDRMTEKTRAGRRFERTAMSTARIAIFTGLALVLFLIALRVSSATDPLPFSSGVAMVLALVLFAIEMNSWDRLVELRQELVITGDRVYRYLDEIPEVGQAVGARFIEPVSKSIVLEAVHYQQLGHQLLKGIDLRIEAKTEVALVSLDPLLPKALAYLLPRFIEPNKGRVLFDGEDIAWGTLESIRAETLYVSAEDPVLSGTVLDNILCGETRYSVQDAIEAAKLVHAHTFISRLPQGYETMLGEHGEHLDAGATFRLGLARAALRDPAVMIIEEPNVLLDDDTKSLIDDAYQRLAATRTMVYLPTRLSTSRRCDKVILLHDGVVEAIGSHQELTKSSELFRHWDYLTFNAFSRRSRRLQKI